MMHSIRPSSHLYQKVPLDPDSDSEDDETTLYAAANLNESTNKQSGKENFGIGVYDHNRDLDLPRVQIIREKGYKGEDPINRRGLSVHMTAIVLICLVVMCLVILLSAATCVLVLSNNVPPSSSSLNPTPSCYSVSKPLPSKRVKPSLRSSWFTQPKSPTAEMTSNLPAVINEISITKSRGVEKTSNLPAAINEGTEHNKITNTAFTATLTSLVPPTSFSFEPSCTPVPTPLPNMQIKPCQSTSTRASQVFPSPTTLSMLETNTNSPRILTETVQENTRPVDTVIETTKPSSEQITANSKKHLSWERSFPGLSESTPQLYDLNGDSFDDVIIVHDLTECFVKVVVLSGQDGTIIWEQNANFSIFSVRCILDINNDGTQDCILTGRTGGFSALSGIDGSLLWVVDHSIVMPTYNFYFPLLVTDMNDDGVMDLVNVHGGDSKYDKDEHDRSPAFLVAVSGKTGEKLMDPIPVPDGHESYMSPVLYTMNAAKQFILFGSGGETVPGSLWAIEMKSLRRRVMSYVSSLITQKTKYVINFNDSFHLCSLEDEEIMERMRPVFNESHFDLQKSMKTLSFGHLQCPVLAGNKNAFWNDYNVCLYEIVRSALKGVILPPVVIDMTGDKVDDLVVSTYDGHTILLDGRDMVTIVWDTHYPGTESYSLPAPIFYTSDDIPDLVIRTNKGAWPDYEFSTIRVLDGTSGSLLWEFNSTHAGMMSAITVTSKKHGRDAILFLAIGAGGVDRLTLQGRDSRQVLSQPNILKKLVEQDGLGEAEDSFIPPQDRVLLGEAEESFTLPQDRVQLDGLGDIDESFAQPQDHIDDDQEPPDLWVSTPDDPVPDPRDLAAMFEYCGRRLSDEVASLFMVTREMIESGMEVNPLATHHPYVKYSQGSNSTHKRSNDHARSESNIDDDREFKIMQMKLLRCSHISSPTAIYTTPLLGDFNSDGRLDIAYLVVWTMTISVAPRMIIVASDLEEMFVKVYGTEILDFGTFLPPEEQPWTQYMGRTGNNIFKLSTSRP